MPTGVALLALGVALAVERPAGWQLYSRQLMRARGGVEFASLGE